MPNAKVLESKKAVVEALSAKIKEATSVVFVDYKGLTVAQDTELRKKFREAGVEYKVYKNTMMKRAFEGTDFAALDEYLEGPSALAVSKDDATAPARILYEFAKEAKQLEIKAGVVEGKAYNYDELSEIAKIPSREILLGRLFGSWQSPVSSFARIPKQIAEKDGAPAEAAEAPAAEAAPAE